ncbi:Uma2 family endonuclease [Leptothoe spongobia]|uniref:Uma2 family endonuclease n=1 Tax=Leptothoe spongobia TAU-MAC 1115 TaxID=1967444 RepID=A0A947DGE5_9CYAN|nr:Uma2 family endonuclease [Leptothoe spongobia]MBT9316381.1 Uma2 family endonuclease [Leptothoe spongobia TAU-MAC 1115]
MYAVVSPEKIQLRPGTVMRMPGSWEDYQRLAQQRGDSSIPRIKYRDGEILLMAPLPVHGRDAHILDQIVTVLLEHREQDYEAFTPITIDLPEEGGIEPDYCFYIDNWQAVVGKWRIDWQTDPPPDLVVEVDVTSFTAAEDYLPYRILEVWIWKNKVLQIYRLNDNGYESVSQSRFFPELSVPELVNQCWQQAYEQGTSVAIKQLKRSL